MLAWASLTGGGLAQRVTSDTSGLSTVTSSGATGTYPDGTVFTITDGGTRGTNLFHSFDEFSVPEGGEANFNNPLTVLNIISRVTGSNPSTIDGTLSAEGSANLFFINPNGIVFGPNAVLSIGGSFVGSTAASVQFPNGVSYAASDTSVNPILSISVPTGLQLGASSQAIRVEDGGYGVLSAQPVVTLDSSSSLRVNPTQTFALIGNGITFQGGTAAAPGGRIALGSVEDGLVQLNATGWIPSYGDINNFADIDLSDRALLNASSALFDGVGTRSDLAAQGGSIQLDGDRVLMSGSAQALIQNFGPLPSGSIDVNARGSVELTEAHVSRKLSSGLTTNQFFLGGGGDINITTPDLMMINDGRIVTTTFNDVQGGKITLRADNIVLSDITQLTTGTTLGGIEAASSGDGRGGDIEIFAETLSIEGDGINSRSNLSGASGDVTVVVDELTIINSGSLSAVAFGEGPGGDVTVRASDIFISGIGAQTFLPSGIYASSVGPGNAGNLVIETQRLVIEEGARVDSSTVASGNAGSVAVTATEAITVTGELPGSINPSATNSSAIISSAERVDPTFKAFLESRGVPPIPLSPLGASGDVTLTTPVLFIDDGAEVTVRNDGAGDAGTLTLNADRIFLDNGAELTASTEQGSGGNVLINAGDFLLLRRGSQLSAEAGGTGDGGNIVLNTSILVALENSDIIANAVQGAGGNIEVNTQGIFGTQFQEALTPQSDITASSQFGVSGEVDIENPETTPSSGLVELPSTVADSSSQIVAGCSETQLGQFVATGRGGLPLAPSQALGANRLWADTRLPANSAESAESLTHSPVITEPAKGDSQQGDSQNGRRVVEAIALSRNTQGEIVLRAPSTDPSHFSTVASDCLAHRVGSSTP
ncbi:MAG: filamentous hemagglutinin N-terminal domain-containing protein [Cyanobacteria bacterium J06598_3]